VRTRAAAARGTRGGRGVTRGRRGGAQVLATGEQWKKNGPALRQMMDSMDL
jgi:hypothetical protein